MLSSRPPRPTAAGIPSLPRTRLSRSVLRLVVLLLALASLSPQAPAPAYSQPACPPARPSDAFRLAGISPSHGLDRLRADLYLMHDRSDSYIPFVASRKLAAGAPSGTLGAHTEFDLFAHVMPDRPLEGLDFVREVAKLYRHAWLFCQEFL